MKFTFEASDIKAGLFVVRQPRNGKPYCDLDFARTVVFKIGYTFALGIPKWGVCNVLTDGLYQPIGDTEQDVADWLNNNEHGFEPLSKKEMMTLMEHTMQGFIQV
jgi:hypothetical protein